MGRGSRWRLDCPLPSLLSTPSVRHSAVLSSKWKCRYIESFAHRSRPQAGGISGFFDMIIMVIIMIMIIIMMIAIRDNDRHTSTTFLCYILPKNIVDWVHKCFCIVEKTFCDILQRYTTRCIHPTFFCIDRLLYKVTQNAQKLLTESSPPNIFWVFFSTEFAFAPSNIF